MNTLANAVIDNVLYKRSNKTVSIRV